MVYQVIFHPAPLEGYELQLYIEIPGKVVHVLNVISNKLAEFVEITEGDDPGIVPDLENPRPPDMVQAEMCG